jgi:hypothetical protein
MNERIESEDYDSAQQIEIQIRELNAAFQHAELENQAYAQNQSLENRLQEVKQKKATCEITWEQRISDFKDRSSRKPELIQQKHEEKVFRN